MVASDEANDAGPGDSGDDRSPGQAKDEALLQELFDLSGDAECSATQVCGSIADTVGRLIKISMLAGKSVARDRYARAEATATESFDDAYDIRHVREKIQEGAAEPWLVDRLGKAITKRREYLRYSREHRQRRNHLPVMMSAAAAAVAPQSLARPSQSNVHPVPASLAPTTPSQPSQQPTVATTLYPLDMSLPADPIEDDRSVSTIATTVIDEGSSNPLRVPDLNSFAAPGQPFDCPFCPTLQTFRSNSSWR